MRSIAIVIALFCMAAGSVVAVQQGKKDKEKEKEKVQKAEVGIVVTLTKRKDNGAYGTSAYSFRYASQDLDVHKNDVDLIYNGCGLLHVAPYGGLKNRIAKVDSPSFAAAKMLPDQGWHTQSIEPEKDAFYVMEIDDGTTHERVKFHILSLTDAEIRFEWTPFRDVTKGTAGTMGQCSGKHGSG